MITKLLRSISSLAMVLIVVSIVPSGALASENGNQTNLTDPMYGLRADPARNITEENFIVVQANILDSINKKITELQSLYSEVSKASNASDLQKVLINHRQAHEGMRSGGRHMGHGGMNQGHCKIPEMFFLNQVENVTDANYTEIQTEITDSLGNTTQMLEAKQTSLKEAGENHRAEELGERITDLKNLSTNVSKASNAAELQDVVLTYVKTQAVDSLKKEVDHLQVKVNESENKSNGNKSNKINSRITELTSLIEDLNEAKSFGDLKEIMVSHQGIPVSGRGPMHHGGCGSSCRP